MREILREDAYKRETGKRYTGDIKKFRDTVGKPGYYIHLTDVPKLGLNPKSSYLPGLYLYPHTKYNYETLIMGHRGNFVAGVASRYAYLVKLRDDLKLLKPDDLNNYLNERYHSIVDPVLEEMLDARILKEPENAKKFYQGDDFIRSMERGDLPEVEVTAEMLERLGDSSYEENAEKIIGLIRSLEEIRPLSGKELKSRAAEVNREAVRVLGEVMGVGNVDVRDGTPYMTEFNGEKNFGVAYSKTGAIVSTSIRKAIENLGQMVKEVTTMRGGVPAIDREKIERRKKESGNYGARYDRLLTHSKATYTRTAALYFFLMGPSGAGTRAKAIGYVLNYPDRGENMLIAPDGGRVKEIEVIRRVRAALLAGMSSSASRMTPPRLKGLGKEELNLLLALGGDEWDGVVDKGTVKNTITYGSLGREKQQTFIKAPINPKLEGGGPVVMLDRMEGLAADKTPEGSTEGTDYMNYEPESPRERELERRYSRPDKQNWKPRITREKFATAQDYPKEDI